MVKRTKRAEFQMFEWLGGNRQFILLDCWYNPEYSKCSDCKTCKCFPVFNFCFVVFNFIILNVDVFKKEN